MDAVTGTGVKDPVCGMMVNPHATRHHHTYKNHSYYFCSAGCHTKFVAEPSKYLTQQSAVGDNPPRGIIYTCPMHPQIRQAGPGNCPICGMTLEPVTVTADVRPNRELADMTRRFWAGLVLTLPVLVLEMEATSPLSAPSSALLRILSNLDSIYFCPRASRLVGGMAILRTRLGVSCAPQPEHVQPYRSWNGCRLLLQPICDLCAGTHPCRIPPDGRYSLRLLRSRRGDHCSRVARPGTGTSRPRTGGAIRALLKLAPKTAHRLKAGGEDEEVALELVQVGDRLRVRPGDGVPVDGEVLEAEVAHLVHGHWRVDARRQAARR